MANNEEQTPSKSGLMGVIKAVAILSILVVVQVVAASFIIPSPEATESLARDLARAKAGQDAADLSTESYFDDAAATPDQDLVEMSLGQFSATRYSVEADKAVTIEFEVYATVQADEADEYVRLFEGNRNRVREQISLTIHGAEPKDLTDRGLGLIKRRILERTNRALGKPMVREVFLTQFNFVQR